MKFLIQRVKNASVAIDGEVYGAIDKGFLVLIGVSNEDTAETADKMITKMLSLRIFEDENGKTNLSIDNDMIKGNLLLVSQFTLYADCRHGNRPSFTGAGAPDHAKELYKYIIDKCSELIGSERVATGSFGADMQVSLLNDGPFTIMFDSDELFPKK